MMSLKIKEEVEEIIDDISTYKTEEAINDVFDRIDELQEYLESYNVLDTSDDDNDYQEILSLIEDIKYLLNKELDALFNEDEDEDY